MFPGMNMNNKQMKQAMKRMGIKQEEINAIQVVIRCEDREIVIDNPSIQKINMAGSKSFQISGNTSERSINQEVEISEEDIKTVIEQTNCSEEIAREAIKKYKGNLAEAIIELSE